MTDCLKLVQSVERWTALNLTTLCCHHHTAHWISKTTYGTLTTNANHTEIAISLKFFI